MTDILEVNDLSVEYKIDELRIRALDQVSISVPDRGSLGIVGESGSGKTTLGMGIMNLIEPPGRISSGQAFCLSLHRFTVRLEPCLEGVPNLASILSS